MNFGSLFSGIGGFDLGFERAGMTCAWQCEIDKDASKVLKNHWPAVPNMGDVKNVKQGSVEKVDVICGGFPCQDVSVAGKRAGLAGERSGLWFEFARVIDELEPRTVVIENVRGLLSSNKGRDFAVVIQWLVQRGYGVCWRVLDAQYFGVPQRRRRVFIVASFGSGRAAEILFERESCTGNTPPSRETRQGVTTASGKSTFGTLLANAGTKQWLGNQEAFSGDYFVMTRAQDVRRLLPIECERLQSFPDGWTNGQSDSVRYRQLGNAVAVPVVEWIAKRIMKANDD